MKTLLALLLTLPLLASAQQIQVIQPNGTTKAVTVSGAAALAADGTLSLSGGGKVVATKIATKTDTFTFSSTNGTWTDIPGLSLTYTPTSASNKILLTASISGANGASTACVAFCIRRDGAIVAPPAAPGNGFVAHATLDNQDNVNSMITCSILLEDATADTASHTWTVSACVVTGGSGTGYVNQTPGNAAAAYNVRAISTLSLEEVTP